jgi:hypothetical protein
VPNGLSIGITTNADEYAAHMTIIAEALVKGVHRTGQEIGKIALERAKWWSSGPIKQAELTKMGHPYARRHVSEVVKQGRTGKARKVKVYARGKPGEQFPNRINTQTGDFLEGWHYRYHVTLGGSYMGTLSNDSEHARFLTRYGTKEMIPRNVMAAIMRDVRKQAAPLYHRVLRDAMAAPKGGGTGRGGVGGYKPWTPTVNVVSAFRRGYSRGLSLGTFAGGI